MSKVFFYILIFQLAVASTCFGSKKDSIISSNSILYEKVYLHVDRDLYSPGDDIWFKSYLVSGLNNKLIRGYKNIYVQLISDSGEIILNRLLLSVNGTANGDFKLHNKIADGNYKIRAYTKYLENFGDESFFYKNIKIAAPKNSLEIQDNLNTETDNNIDVAFLPESGSFVLNAINHIAFKAVNSRGEGIQISGKIVDETGNEVVSFSSKYKGMGEFIMIPQEDKSYFALINEYPDFTYSFKPAIANGVCLNFKPDGKYLQFTLTRNLKTNTVQNYILRASHKGIELFSSQITMSKFQHAQRLYKGLFPLGISMITLLDNKNNKVAERLVFVQGQKESTIQINTDKKEYKKRDKVAIDIVSLLPDNDTIVSSMSVAIVHEDYFSSKGITQNMESFLLLDSDLKGSIESPASCFIDENSISSEEKLDLVMMINGWRNYYWNDLEDKVRLKLPNWSDVGLTLNGSVKSLWGEKPVDGGKVILGPFSRNFLFEETITDLRGNFKFDRLYLKDSALIMINSKTRRGFRRTTPILNPQNIYNSLVNISAIQNICAEVDIPMKFYRDNYYRLLAERKYKVETGTILLDEIEVESDRMDIGDGHFRLYGEADVILNITDDDSHHIDVISYLDSRVPGVLVTGDQISIRNSPNNPLLLIDGLEVEWDRINEVPIGDIDKIEILKSGYSSAVYGSRGGDGVIAILTKMGKGEWENNFERIIHGRITPRVRGFQQAREFYSPKYTLENINNPKPDYRPTLFWNPQVNLENGKAKLEFYTADNLARYKIIVEGVSKNGKICCGSNLLTISIP